MADEKFPFKENFGATKQDLARGFTEGMHPNEPDPAVDEWGFPVEDLEDWPPERPPGGFLGRSKGQER